MPVARHSRWLSWLCSCVVSGLVIGCGGGEQLVPVEGNALVDGQPLATGSLSFEPDANKGNTSQAKPAGLVENGKYKVFTAGKPGAPLGWYKITAVAEEPIDPKNPYVPRKSLINMKYVKESDLALEIVEKPAAGAYDLNLKK
jgi:hypothetical protein